MEIPGVPKERWMGNALPMTKAVDANNLTDFFFRKKENAQQTSTINHTLFTICFSIHIHTVEHTNYKNDIFIENAAYLHIFIDFFDTNA